MKNFLSPDWVRVAISVLAMCIGVTSFSYSTFLLKDDYKEDKAQFYKRLERIESKVDQLLERR